MTRRTKLVLLVFAIVVVLDVIVLASLLRGCRPGSESQRVGVLSVLSSN